MSEPTYDEDGSRIWQVGQSDWTSPDSWAEVERRAAAGDQLADLCLALHRHALDTAELDGLSTTDDADIR